MATGLLDINHDFFSSKLFDEPVFRQCAQSTKCHFDEVTFRRNGSLDEVSFDEVSHFAVNILRGWLTNAKLLFQRGRQRENFLSPAVKYFSSC